jgi:hypothetical protein
MNRYYILEINLKKLRNKINLLSNLENKYEKKIYSNNIILSVDGYYKLEKEHFIKYKIIEKDFHEMTSNNLTIIGNYISYKKFENQYSFPVENKQINIKKYHFFDNKNKNIFLVLEYFNNKLNDLYFLSKKDIRENNMFFLHDISSFMETLNI